MLTARHTILTAGQPVLALSLNVRLVAEWPLV